MGSLSFDNLRDANVRRARDSFKGCREWTLGDWGNAMAGEAGEACNVIKKIRRGDFDGIVGSPKPQEGRRLLADELADVVVYADLIAARQGIDLGEAVRRKFNEVSERVDSQVRL